MILLFALLRLGIIPVLAMPSQRALDIDALMALAQPAAYVIHGESHADLARQMARKRLPATFWSQVRAKATILRRSSRCAANGRRGRSPMLPAPRCCCSQAAPPGRQSLSHDGTLTICYNFSASAELCGLKPQSVSRRPPVAHNFPLACPGILGTLACGGKVVLTDSASCDE